MPQRYLWPNTQHPASFLRSDSTCRKVTECSTILCLFFEIFEVRLWMLVQEATIGQRWIPSRLLHHSNILTIPKQQLQHVAAFRLLLLWHQSLVDVRDDLSVLDRLKRNVPHWAERWYLLILSSCRFRCFNTIQYVCFSFMSFRRHLTSQSHCSCTCWVPHHCGWPAECSLEWCAASCSPAEAEHAKYIFGTHKCSQYLSDGKTMKNNTRLCYMPWQSFQQVPRSLRKHTRWHPSGKYPSGGWQSQKSIEITRRCAMVWLPSQVPTGESWASTS